MRRNALTARRLAAAFSIGLGAVAACGAASPEPGARVGEAGSGPPEAAVGADPAAADAGADGARCPHGALEDPHHGFVRCLTPDEADAGYRPPSQSPSDAGASDGSTDGGAADGAAPVSGPPPQVEVGTPVFENGDVQTLQKTLGKLSGDFAKCVADNGGLTAATGSIKLQFLVRVRERAEGVEVLAHKNVSPEASSCVKGLLKNRWVGTPSADPVGVTVTLSLKAAK